MSMNDRNDKKYPRRVICPTCGYEMPVYYDAASHCGGVTVTCKGRNCHSVFEIKIKSGEQIR